MIFTKMPATEKILFFTTYTYAVYTDDREDVFYYLCCHSFMITPL